jgi:NADPH2:quinone reductase
VIDLTTEGLVDGVRRITGGSGVDIVIESIGGTLAGEALSSLGLGGILITLGYSNSDRRRVAGHHPADRERIN